MSAIAQSALAQLGFPSDPICRLRALADGAEIPGQLEYDVKAALLYRCLELVQWPSDASAPGQSTLIIGILGKNQFGESLNSLAGKSISGRKLVIKKMSRSTQPSRFQLIFVSASELKRTPKILANLAGLPVLTVGEVPGFTEQGGIINLLLQGKNIRLEVNQVAAEKAGIVMDPRLIKLASEMADSPSTPGAAVKPLISADTR